MRDVLQPHGIVPKVDSQHMSLNSDNGHTNRKTLVTGGAGFIGSHLVERLLSVGNQVVILDNFNDFYDPAFKRTNIERLLFGGNGSSLKVVEGDIRDANLVNDLFEANEFEEVFHLAAMAGVRPSLKNPKLYFDVNVQGTITLLDAAVAFGKPEIIFASSSSVYGGSPDVPFTENDPVNQPVSPYAASKKSAELICHTYSHLHGLNTVCLRFFTVYGPRQRPEMAITVLRDESSTASRCQCMEMVRHRATIPSLTILLMERWLLRANARDFRFTILATITPFL